MLIPCPFCGERPHSEFTYGGDATVQRPRDPQLATDEEWHAYLYLRPNPRGGHREHWHHTLGCDRWVEVVRDTLSHDIDRVVGAGASS